MLRLLHFFYTSETIHLDKHRGSTELVVDPEWSLSYRSSNSTVHLAGQVGLVYTAGQPGLEHQGTAALSDHFAGYRLGRVLQAID